MRELDKIALIIPLAILRVTIRLHPKCLRVRSDARCGSSIMVLISGVRLTAAMRGVSIFDPRLPPFQTVRQSDKLMFHLCSSEAALMAFNA
jgi:hypothetical protein